MYRTMLYQISIREYAVTLPFESLSQKTYALHGLQEQICYGLAKEDVRPLLPLIDDCIDTMFNELEKVKRAVEDIFNPIEEEYCNVSV
jgi:hypothetical protein